MDYHDDIKAGQSLASVEALQYRPNSKAETVDYNCLKFILGP